MNIEEISRRIEGLVKFGTVKEYIDQNKTVIVQSGGLVSAELKYIAPACGEIRIHRPPSVGEGCIVISASGEMGSGFVILGVETDTFPIPANGSNLHLVKYQDGATISYDQNSGELIATGIKKLQATAQTEIALNAPKIILNGMVEATKSVTAAGVVNANGGLAAQEVEGGATGTALKISVPVHFEKAVTPKEVIQDDHQHQYAAGGGLTGKPQ